MILGIWLGYYCGTNGLYLPKEMLRSEVYGCVATVHHYGLYWLVSAE